jgi:predicted SAM-dependent methyltransferase
VPVTVKVGDGGASAFGGNRRISGTMSDDVNVWLALDPEQGVIRLVLNGHTIGSLTGPGRNPQIKVDPAYQQQFGAVAPYAQQLFANMGDTLSTALFEVGAFRVNAVGVPAAATIPETARTQIHLGCGPDERPGWLNIDYRYNAPLGYDPVKNFLNLDLRAGLPLPDASAELIFSSHFFEHLRHEEATGLMRECRRVLKPGGVIRFQMPDYGKGFKAYVERDPTVLAEYVGRHGLLNHMPPYARQWGDLISRAVYEFYEHKYVWDVENLGIALREAGFSQAFEVEPQPGLDNLRDLRAESSFYMQAVA